MTAPDAPSATLFHVKLTDVGLAIVAWKLVGLSSDV